MIDEQKLKEIMMTLGIGKNDVARDYSQEPIRFLVDKESVELHFDGHSGCCYVNNDVNRQMWFSQFNGIYISFEEHFKKIEIIGSGELILLNRPTLYMSQLSCNDFIGLVNGKTFENGYSLESDPFHQLVDSINADPYEALSNKTIRKGNCYILTEINKK